MQKCLIIGASQTKYFCQYLPPSSDCEVTVNTVSGRKVQDVDDGVLAEVHSFDHVIVHLGTNNIPYDVPDTTARRMDRLLKEIRLKNPECTVYVSSVLPRAVSWYKGAKENREEIEELNRKAIQLNTSYQDLLTRFERSFFINNDSHFMDGDKVKRELLSWDGLHLTPNGINALLGNMLSSLVCIQSCTSSNPPPPPASAFLPLPCFLLSEVSPVVSTSSSQHFLSYRDALLLPSPLQSSTAPQPSSLSQSFSPSQDRNSSGFKFSSSRFNSFQGRKSVNSQSSKPSPVFSQSFHFSHSRVLSSSPSSKTSVLSQPPDPHQGKELRKKPSNFLSKYSFSLLKKLQPSSSSNSVSQPLGPSQGRKRSSPRSSFHSTSSSSFLQRFSFSHGKKRSKPKSCFSSNSLPGFSPSQGRKPAEPQSSKPASSLSHPVSSSRLTVCSGSRLSESSVSSQQRDPISHLKSTPSFGPSLSQCRSPTQGRELMRGSSQSPEPTLPSNHSQNICYGKKFQSRSTCHSLDDFKVPLVNRFQILRNRDNLFLPHHHIKRAKFPLYEPVNGGGRPKEFNYLEPRQCDQCNRSYKSKQAFSRHKKTCSVKNKGLSSLYPRTCEVCNNSYPTRQRFYNHKKTCSSPEDLEEQNPLTVKHVRSVSKIYKRTCHLCKQNFKRRQHFWRHSKICGKKTKKYPLRKCDACGRTYKNKDSFFAHKVRCGKKPAEKIVYPRSCPSCSEIFFTSMSFWKHRKFCLRVGTAVSCTYTDCGITFHSHKSMLHHLKSSHLNQATQVLSFDSIAQFMEWKKKEDRKNFSFQKKVCGSKVSENGTGYHYYKCIFNVPKRSEKRNRRKTVRKKRHGQIPERACPSEMTVKEFYDGSVSVTYISCHSHSLSEKNCTFHQWSPETRHDVKELLKLGVDPNVIRKKFTRHKGINEPYPLREHYMTTREISRYKYWLKIQERKAKDDATAIKKRVDAMTPEERKNILVYKPQGCNTYIGDVSFDSLKNHEKLFVYGFQTERQLNELRKGAKRAVCLDATYKTNRYGFNLVNVLVPDEFGCGFIVAQFIINCEKTDAYYLLFRTIQKRCPDLIVNAVMTDDDPAIWNAFEAAFPQDDPKLKAKHLLCSWHILEAWKKNLPKIKDAKLRLEVKKELNVLLKERNAEVFKQLLSAFIEKRSEPATAAFLEYFRSTYEHRAEKWAMCYRNFAHGDIDTNNMLESSHRTIKLRLNRKCNLMAYDLIEATEDMEDERWQKLHVRRRNGEPPADFQNKRDCRHHLGMQIPHASVVKLSENKWHIKYEKKFIVKNKDKIPKIKTVTRKYDVIKQFSKCNIVDHCYDKCSNLSCSGLCSHLYYCSCPDIANICKHVHRVHSLQLRNIPRSLNIVTSERVEFDSETNQGEYEVSCNEDVIVSSGGVETKKKELEEITLNVKSLPNNKTIDFESLVIQLRNLTDSGGPGVENHIVATLKSELEYLEGVKQPLVVPPMPCSFAPNQKAPLQPKRYRTRVKRIKSPVLPKMYRTRAKRSKSVLSSLEKQIELNTAKTGLLSFKKGTRSSSEKQKEATAESLTLGCSSETIVLDFETPFDDNSDSPNPPLLEGQSLPPIVEPLSKKFVTERHLQSVSKSKVSRGTKSKSFTEEIVSEIAARAIFKFKDFYISAYELQSLDHNISTKELKFLQALSPCFIRGWLYDSVIDVYLGILCNEKPDIFVFRTPFVQTVAKTAQTEDSFSRLPSYDYKSCRTIFIPSSLSDNHWILLVVDVQGKKLHVLDPMEKIIQECHEAVLTKWRRVLSFALKEDVSKWAQATAPDHSLQKDAINCGPLVCYYVFKLIQNEDPKCYVDPSIFRKFMYSTIKSNVQPWIRSSMR